MTATTPTDYSGFVRHRSDGQNSLLLAVEGMNCPACAFKIERTLNAHENVEARVNVTEKRMTVTWPGDIALGNRLVEEACGLGFRFSPVREGAEKAQGQEKFLLRCLAVAGFSSGNLMIFSLVLWFSLDEDVSLATRDLMHWYSALIALPAVVYAGLPFYRSAWTALKAGRTNMDVPIAVSIILTTAMSLFETIRGGTYVYFDSAVMLLFLLLVGRFLDARARARTRGAAADLLSFMSGAATVAMEDGTSRRIPADDIRPGMKMLVAKGEKALADGIALSATLADASALTGETLPQHIPAGESFLAGMVNLGEPLTVRVEKEQKNSLFGDIITLMQKAEQGNALYVRIADRIASWYTPVVHLLALATFLGWWMQGGLAWQSALMRAVTVLIITCPCALGLAVPVAQVVAGSRLFRKGMLLKSADALERLDQVDTIVFDKTGTLTTGDITLNNRHSFAEEELALISGLAAHSRHPLACAVSNISRRQALGNIREHEGKGIEGLQDGSRVRLGSAAFCGVEEEAQDDKMELWLSQAGKPPKRLILSDTLHHDAPKTIAALKKKYRLLMLSGDRHAVAKAVADRLGIDVFMSRVNPRQKLDIIEAEVKRGHRVLMVGDGLNDAAALARATASMSPSSALGIAQNAADIVYQREGISCVKAALETAQATQRIVRQNFALALAYNVIAVPLAMAGHVTPLVAAAAMSASSLAVIANALRLKGE